MRLRVAAFLLFPALQGCPEAPSPPASVPATPPARVPAAPPGSVPATPPDDVPAAPPPGRIQVTWDRSISVYDVLGRDPAAVQLVQVPRRSLPPGVQSDFGDRDTFGPGSPPYRVVTVCGDRHCADGLVTRDQVTITPPRNPCMGSAEQVNRDLTVQSAPCTFTVDPALTSDERETKGPSPDSWLERGIRVVSGDDASVSFHVASAWFTAGAAHSDASFECRTTDRAGHVKSLADAFPGGEARSMVEAVRAFLTEQRELDARATELRMPPADPAAVRDFVLPAPPDTGVLLCLVSDIETYAGRAQMLRIQLAR